MSGVDYEKVHRLLAECNEDLTDRQMAVLRRIARVNVDGFILSELGDVQRVFQLTAALVTPVDAAFADVLVELVSLCSKPFRATKANEEALTAPRVCDLLRVLAHLLTVPEPRVQLAVAEVFLSLAAHGEDPDARGPDDWRPSSWAHNHEMIARSGVIKSLVEALKLEVRELSLADTNRDGVVDDDEYHRYKVTNDGDDTNDAETYGESASKVADDAMAAADPSHPSNQVETPKAGALRTGAGSGSGSGAGAGAGAGSGVAESDAEGSEVKPEPSYLLLVLVRLMKELSEFGKSATIITNLGAVEACAKILTLMPDFREEITRHIIELFWNTLERSYELLSGSDVALSLKDLLVKHRASNAAHVLGTLETISTLCELLHSLFQRGYRCQDKELRNELIIVATLLARKRENRPLFHEAGFLDLVLMYGTAAEMTVFDPELRHRNFATTEPEDLELRELLWGFVGVICHLTPSSAPAHGAKSGPLSEQEEDEREAMLGSVRGSLFINTLLLYLDPVESHSQPFIQGWSPAQGRQLDLLALRLLSALAPLCPEQFKEASGPQVLLLLIRKHSPTLTLTRAPEEHESDADVAGLEDGDPDADRVQLSLVVLRETLPVLDDAASLLGTMGAVSDLVAIAASFDVEAAGKPLAATATGILDVPLSALEVLFTLLARLCSNNKENQRTFRREGGVSVILDWLRFPTDEDITKPQVVLATVMVLWEAVVGNKKNEARFVAEGGMDALIDLMEIAPVFMRGQVVGCLSDLCSNPMTHTYVRVWKSDRTGRSTASYLLEFWGNEEDRINGDLGLTTTLSGTSTGRFSGTISDGRPAFDRLRRALKAAKMWRNVEPAAPGMSVFERVGSHDLRPKIWGVLSAVGFEHAEDEIKGNFDDLSPSEKATLCLVSRYDDYRKGAEWREVVSGIKPIEPDAMLAEGKISTADAIAMEVSVQQDMQHASEADKKREDEDKFITGVLARRHAEEESYRLAVRRIGSGAMSLQEWLSAKARLGR